jgi:hypothetical protein
MLWVPSFEEIQENIFYLDLESPYAEAFYMTLDLNFMVFKIGVAANMVITAS